MYRCSQCGAVEVACSDCGATRIMTSECERCGEGTIDSSLCHGCADHLDGLREDAEDRGRRARTRVPW